MGMLDYGALKSRLTIATAALVAIGTATFAVTGGHLHVNLCMRLCAQPGAHSLTRTAALCCSAQSATCVDVCIRRIGGWETAAPFAVGGTAGLLYQLLMQRSVDAIPGGSGGYSAVGMPCPAG